MRSQDQIPALSQRAILQPLRRRHLPGRFDQRLDHPPIEARVQSHADPARRSDVGWAEKVLRVGRDERLLHPLLRLEQNREMRIAMMVGRHHREHLPHAPRRLAPGELLRRAGEGKADLAHALERLYRAKKYSRPTRSASSSPSLFGTKLLRRKSGSL